MSIVSPADFNSPTNVPNNDHEPEMEQLQSLIDMYEPELLVKLLGQSLYDDLLAGLNEDPILPKWSTLRDKLVKSILNYVYWFYTEEKVQYASGIGTVQGKSEGAVSVSSWDIMVKAWNRMVENNKAVHKFLGDNNTDYPDFVVDYYVWQLCWYGYFEECVPEIYRYKNTLNL